MSTKKLNQPLGGKLEREVMEVIWKLGDTTVRQVLTELKKKRDIAYTTVMTIMARLTDKNLLSRQLEAGGAYVYRPIYNKQEYLNLASQKAITGLIKTYGEIAVAQFVNTMENSSSKELEEWQRKLKNIQQV